MSEIESGKSIPEFIYNGLSMGGGVNGIVPLLLKGADTATQSLGKQYSLLPLL
ncbi:hypothetical protein [Anaerobiospirillum sp. NML120449]|uniref:hypothetical protein n=1 Tax=Anaerobiospirillum sp. NML120449 TaxID=2932817 RepID=UPI001FF695FA|nr:hypothetical protein [Anaerobiospirillum sp. NML120449]MCK0526427.1 hypothetical protein [Anaerobiospirillum sp. NML120449]